MHVLRVTPTESIYTARSEDDEICLITIGTGGVSGATCTPPASFATRGLTTGLSGGGTNVELQWDGTTITEKRPTR